MLSVVSIIVLLSHLILRPTCWGFTAYVFSYCIKRGRMFAIRQFPLATRSNVQSTYFQNNIDWP